MKILMCLIGVVLSLLLLITHSSSASTTYESTAIVGQWVLPDGSAVVQIEPIEGGEYTGIVRSLLRPEFSSVDGYGEPGQPRVDVNNPDEQLQGRPVLGLQIAQGLAFDGDQWNGKIYDPASGNTYRCRITLEANGYARVRGYVGISMLGRTMYWQRLESYQSAIDKMLQALSLDA